MLKVGEEQKKKSFSKIGRVFHTRVSEDQKGVRWKLSAFLVQMRIGTKYNNEKSLDRCHSKWCPPEW